MKGKNLLILVVLAVVLVGLATMTSRNKNVAPPGAIGGKVLPGIAVNDIQKITVTSGSGTVMVQRKDDAWTMPGKFDYPADFDKIRNALLKAADIQVGQVVKADEKQKAALKMIVPLPKTSAVPESIGTLVELKGPGDKVLGQLLLGDVRRKKQDGAPDDYPGYPDGRYISNDAGKSVFLVKDELSEFPVGANDWLNAEIINVALGEIRELVMVSTNGETMKFSKSGDSLRYQLDGLGEKEELDSDKMALIESGLSYMRFDDLADPKSEAAVTGLDKPAIFKATGTNDLVYEVKIGNMTTSGSGRYVQLAMTAADIKEEPAKVEEKEVKKDEAVKTEAKPEEKKAEPEAQKAPTAAERRMAAESLAKDLNSRVAKWIYIVSASKTDPMLHVRKDIVKPKSEEKKEEKE